MELDFVQSKSRKACYIDGKISHDCLLFSALGAKVIATASTQEKLDVCSRYGKADYAINYSKQGWQQEVLRLTGGKGVGK